MPCCVACGNDRQGNRQGNRVKGNAGVLSDLNLSCCSPLQALLGDPTFMQQLQNYDKDNIPANIVAIIKPYVEKPEFDPALVQKASKAAYGLCCWVR